MWVMKMGWKMAVAITGSPMVPFVLKPHFIQRIYIYIYLYIFIYIYIHSHKHTHAHTNKHTLSHTHIHKRSLIGFLCSSKNSWQPESKAKKGLFCCQQCPRRIVSQRQTLVFIWQVEPVPAWDRNNLPLAQTQISKTFCLVPAGV